MKFSFRKLRGNWFHIIAGIFIFLNLILITAILKNLLKSDSNSGDVFSNRPKFTENKILDDGDYNFYNIPCPNISGRTVGGENINLTDFASNIIIIQFSRFWKQDLPKLLYIQQLEKKFKSHRVFLIYINSLGKHYEKEIGQFINISSPIIIDDGTILSDLSAFPEDLFILDRNFNIRFKYQFAEKQIIYRQLIKLLNESDSINQSISTEEIQRVIQKLHFLDIYQNEYINIFSSKKKYIVLTLFTSVCTSCKENQRVLTLRNLASKKKFRNINFILIFGEGNSIESIRRYSLLRELNTLPFVVGIIQEVFSEDYFKIFQLDVDPKTYVLNSEGKIIHIENQKNSHKFDGQIEAILNED